MSRIVKNIPLMDLAAYLIETVNSPTHVGLLQIFEPKAGAGSETVQRVLHAYRTTVVGPPFNYYPVFPRFGMPKWAEAERFDVDYHIRHLSVPAPGTDRQVIDMAMDLHAGIMDRSRPGWIAYVIEGLENNAFAVYWKVHHAYIDGASAVMRLEAALSRTAEDQAIRPLWGPLFEPTSKTRDRSLGESLGAAGRGLGVQAKAMADISRAIGRSIQQARGKLEREAPLPFSAPQSLFNKPVFATRNLGVGTAALDRFKAIAKRQKVSINEVALTLVGAGLDRYALKYGDLPGRPLVATCPMAVRAEGDTSASTQIAAISVKLGDSDRDIARRLRQVHASSADAKSDAKDMSREALMNYLVLLGGAATLISKTPLGDYIPPLTSVNVSNVAGPAYRCFHGGAEMVRSYPLSTLAGGTAINITFTSFSGRMDFAVVTDAKALPGAQEIADYMLEALEELEQTTREKRRAAPKAGKTLRPKTRSRNAS